MKNSKKHILAVIPARAGSKGIPNKNIRIVNGNPLIYYAIKNAIESEEITDVIITTDSEDVRIIAEQLGVSVKMRNEELCGDDITLDEVIFDAIPSNKKWDYIITMQPTSPTLKKETLDCAIRFTEKNNIDTLISVINRPHLSWKKENGRIVPAYEKRVNRQYLPNQYLETGAFVISRSEVVTRETRIGERIEVWELDEDEAHDIDTFEDLLSASSILRREKIAIYVNGNNSRGMGHIYRALEIADEFYVKPDIFFDNNQTNINVFGKTTHSIKPVNGISELYDVCKKEQYTLFINDILDTSIDYMIGLRTVLPKAHIVNFEDEGEGGLKADLVINALLSEKTFPHVYVGEKYYIPSKLFMYYSPINIREEVHNVFICFGGADPMDYTDAVLRIISKPEYKDISFFVALGRVKHNVEELMKYNRFDNIEVLYDVKNMPEMMTKCDVAISSRGRTVCELAMLGIPTIVISENQREMNHNFACNENGFTYIGFNPSVDILEANIKMYIKLTKEDRNRFHNMLLSHDLRNGRKQVMSLINSL